MKFLSQTSESAPRSAIAHWVVGVCVCVIVYASLQPFAGWMLPPENARFFLWQFAQRWTIADAIFNVVAYVPLGLALVIALPRNWSRSRCLTVTVLIALALSLTVETAQMWLPTRYASVYDTLANVVGALFGALLGLVAVASQRLVALIEHLRNVAIVPGHSGDLQLVLLAVWLLAQVNPAIPLFGAAFHPGNQAAYEPAVVLIELTQTASALIGIGLFTDLTMRKRWMGGIALVFVLVLAIVMKLAAAQAVLKPLAWDEWLRPGHSLGLAVGAFSLMILFWLPRRAKSVLAGIALLSSVLIMLLLPDLVATKAPLSIFSWNYGHLLHLNGLTRTIVLFWPFIATGVLLWRFVATSGSETGLDNTIVGNA
jgi:VanZ family protein